MPTERTWSLASCVDGASSNKIQPFQLLFPCCTSSHSKIVNVNSQTKSDVRPTTTYNLVLILQKPDRQCPFSDHFLTRDLFPHSQNSKLLKLSNIEPLTPFWFIYGKEITRLFDILRPGFIEFLTSKRRVKDPVLINLATVGHSSFSLKLLPTCGGNQSEIFNDLSNES
jgi:hypothetical protein